MQSLVWNILPRQLIGNPWTRLGLYSWYCLVLTTPNNRHDRLWPWKELNTCQIVTAQIWRCCINISYYTDVIWGPYCLKSPTIDYCSIAIRLTTKKTSKLGIIHPFWWESNGNLTGMSRRTDRRRQRQYPFCLKGQGITRTRWGHIKSLGLH